MGIFIVASTQLPMSTLTLAETERIVAGVVSREGSPEAVGARDAIQQVFRRLNGDRWDHLTVRGSDITVFDHRTRVAGQEGFEGKYSVPARVRDFVSAKLRDSATPGPGGIPLRWVLRGDWDRMVQAGAGSGTRYITDFEYGTTGTVELLDWPEAAGFLELRYWRNLRIPVSSNEGLDVPADGPLEAAVIDLAKAIVAADKGAVQKYGIYRRDGEAAYKKALATDRIKFLHDPDWTPEHERSGLHPAREKRYDAWGTWRREL